MAHTLIRIVDDVRLEAATGLGTGTGTLYIQKKVAENRAVTFYDIWGAGAPNDTTLASATAGSRYTDYTNGQMYVWNGTSWVSQT